MNGKFCPPLNRYVSCTNLTVEQITCLIDQILAAKLPSTLASVTDCLVVTIPGAWGELGDIIQNIRWFDTAQTPPTSFLNVYINNTTNETVTGITTENTKPCESLNRCCGNIEFADSESITVHDCGDYYRSISFEVNVSEEPGNIISLLPDGFFAKITPYATSVAIVSDTVDGADTLNYSIAGGHQADTAAGGSITVYGNESPIGIAGGVNIGLGDAANATVDLGYGGAITSHVRLYANSILQWQTTNAVAFDFKNASNESTGANTVTMTNSPAAAGNVYKWLKVFSSDGSTCYIPMWKA